MNYILYKEPIELRLLCIVRYLHNINIKGRPKYCIERNYPEEILQLPTIYCINDEKYYQGLDECIKYYMDKTNIKDLYLKSQLFMKNNPNYRINGI